MKFKVKKKMKSMLILSFFVFAWSFNLGANVFVSGMVTRGRERRVNNIYIALDEYKETVESLGNGEKEEKAKDDADDWVKEGVNYNGYNIDGTRAPDEYYEQYKDPLAQKVGGDNAGNIENVERWGPDGDIREIVARDRYHYPDAFLEGAPVKINEATAYLKRFKK